MDTVDRLTSLLDRFTVRARTFHTGPLCGLTRFDAVPGRGFLHILRRGELTVTHGRGGTPPARTVVEEPSLLFYPRPLEHTFHTPREGADLACASLDFDGGDRHPLVRALPDFVLVPIAEVAGLERSLDLLADEIDDFRCGRRLLADRMFEIVLLKLVRWLLDHPAAAGVPAGLFTGLSEPRIARALVAVHDAPGEHWTIESLARTARMSRSAFAALFRALVGTTPNDYLTTWRLTIAQQRLREGRTMTEIAGELGYSGPSALSRVFSQRLGCSPRAWLADAA